LSHPDEYGKKIPPQLKPRDVPSLRAIEQEIIRANPTLEPPDLPETDPATVKQQIARLMLCQTYGEFVEMAESQLAVEGAPKIPIFEHCAWLHKWAKETDR